MLNSLYSFFKKKEKKTKYFVTVCLNTSLKVFCGVTDKLIPGKYTNFTKFPRIHTGIINW